MEIIKNIRKNTIIILLVTITVLFFVLKDDFSSTVSALQIMDYKYLVLATILFGFSLFLKAIVSYQVVNQKEKYSLKEAVKHTIIIQFFNGVTPFSTGGQPMEVYMLKEHGIRISRGTNFILQNFIFYQISLVILGIFAVVYNGIFHLFPEVDLLKKLVLLGFLINTLVAVVLLLIAISKKTTHFLMVRAVNILARLKIIKNKEKVIANWEERINEFHQSTKELSRRKGLIVSGITLNLLSLILFYLVPLLIVYSMHNFTSLNAIESIVASAYVLIIGSFVPIPGASGGIEYAFLTFFHAFLNSGETSAILLVWRFITYYLPMILGALVFNLEGGKTKCE